MKKLHEPPSVYVLSVEDYDRIDGMIASLRHAVETLFDRRLIEPRKEPDDIGDFDDVAGKVHRDYLF